MKFLLFVEGHLEQKILPGFLKRWLDPQLPEPATIPKPINFRGCGSFVKKIGRAARGHLESPKGEELTAAVAVLDLHGPQDHGFFPDDMNTVAERYEWGVEKITSQVDHPKFRLFFAVHEIEAWLFSQPGLFPTTVRDALFKDSGDPEDIDFDEPPAKRLVRVYAGTVKQKKLGHCYNKLSHGVNLFSGLDPATAYAKCPYLRRMLDELLELADNQVNVDAP